MFKLISKFLCLTSNCKYTPYCFFLVNTWHDFSSFLLYYYHYISPKFFKSYNFEKSVKRLLIKWGQYTAPDVLDLPHKSPSFNIILILSINLKSLRKVETNAFFKISVISFSFLQTNTLMSLYILFISKICNAYINQPTILLLCLCNLQTNFTYKLLVNTWHFDRYPDRYPDCQIDVITPINPNYIIKTVSTVSNEPGFSYESIIGNNANSYRIKYSPQFMANYNTVVSRERNKSILYYLFFFDHKQLRNRNGENHFTCLLISTYLNISCEDITILFNFYFNTQRNVTPNIFEHIELSKVFISNLSVKDDVLGNFLLNNYSYCLLSTCFDFQIINLLFFYSFTWYNNGSFGLVGSDIIVEDVTVAVHLIYARTSLDLQVDRLALYQRYLGN